MPFEFLMLSVVAHEFYVFIYKGYSWLLSFSCFCFLLTFLNKATHARFFLIVRLLMPFEFLMLSFVAHELFFFHEGCSWFLSFSCFYFLFIFLNRLLIFLARLLMPFGFLMVSFVAREFLVVCFVFFFLLATHDFWDSHDHCFLSLMSFYVFFLNEGFSWLLSFSCSNLMCFVFFSRASHDFWTSHVVICCSWVFSFSIGYSWFLSCSCAFCYSCFF